MRDRAVLRIWDFERMNAWVVPCACLTCSLSISVVAAVGIRTRITSPVSIPNLYAGLLVFGVLGTLLSIPLVENVWRKHRRRHHGTNQVTSSSSEIQPPPWSRTAASVCRELRVAPARGLTTPDARDRLREYGSNRIGVSPMPTYLSFFVKEIYEPTQLLLLGVGALYVMFGSLEEGMTAFTVIILAVIAEVSTEWRATRAVAALKLSTPRDAVVRRNGQLHTIAACDVVPGDVVQLGVGMVCPADVRIIRSQFLEVDESKTSTAGESVPVPKDSSAEESSLVELSNIVTAGSVVTKGRATGVVFQTGVATILGQLCSKDRNTGFELGLKDIAWVLSVVAFVASALGALLGVLKHMRWQEIVLSSLSLAFATIPEELPILVAAVLAVGSRSLSQKNVFVKYLGAAENLGFVDTVLTDIAGTLTENKLVLQSMHFGDGVVVDAPEIGVAAAEPGFDAPSFEALVKAWVFMSEIGDGACESGEELGSDEVVDEIHLDVMAFPGAAAAVELECIDSSSLQTPPDYVCGDVFDRAILEGFGVALEQTTVTKSSVPALVAGDSQLEQHLHAVQAAKAEANLSDETPFCPTLKFATRTFSMLRDSTRRADLQVQNVHQVTYMKGAPELLLELSTYALQDGKHVLIENMRQQLEEQISGVASAGLRVMGYARNVTHRTEDIANQARGDPSRATALEGTTFLGFMACRDAVRAGVAEAVTLCHQAGVRIVMVTGDHLRTGLSIALASRIILRDGDDEGVVHAAGVSCADVQLHCLPDEQARVLVSETSVFARATPDDKLVILETLQGSNKCVMATGDGFNDAPILAKADVGAAMGKATDVAREASSIVFMDGDFAMVPFALAEGRRLLDNLQKAVSFYLGAKIGLIVLFVVGTLWKRFPLRAIHIIVLELFMDLGAITSFVTEPADTDIIMNNKPPPPWSCCYNLNKNATTTTTTTTTKRFFNRELMLGILISSLSMALTVLASFAYALRHAPDTAQSSAFLAWLLAHVLLALNLRTARESVFRKGILTNSAMLVWLSAVLALAATSAASETLRRHLKLVVMPGRQWLVIAAICVCGTFWVEVAKCVVAGACRVAGVAGSVTSVTSVTCVGGDENREERVSLLAAAAAAP